MRQKLSAFYGPDEPSPSKGPNSHDILVYNQVARMRLEGPGSSRRPSQASQRKRDVSASHVALTLRRSPKSRPDTHPAICKHKKGSQSSRGRQYTGGSSPPAHPPDCHFCNYHLGEHHDHPRQNEHPHKRPKPASQTSGHMVSIRINVCQGALRTPQAAAFQELTSSTAVSNAREKFQKTLFRRERASDLFREGAASNRASVPHVDTHSGMISDHCHKIESTAATLRT